MQEWPQETLFIEWTWKVFTKCRLLWQQLPLPLFLAPPAWENIVGVEAFESFLQIRWQFHYFNVPAAKEGKGKLFKSLFIKASAQAGSNFGGPLPVCVWAEGSSGCGGGCWAK